jgi:hypothetical protein
MRRRYDIDQATGRSSLSYVAPSAVRYNREDIEFLLPWLKQMREGAGPHEPESGYVGGKKTGISPRAGYELWCQVAAEIDNRLQRTGMDRFLVERHYCDGLDIETIACWVFLPTREIQRRINSALSYISSGPCPRWLHCVDCKNYKHCRQKRRVGITYKDWKSHRRIKLSQNDAAP